MQGNTDEKEMGFRGFFMLGKTRFSNNSFCVKCLFSVEDVDFVEKTKLPKLLGLCFVSQHFPQRMINFSQPTPIVLYSHGRDKITLNHEGDNSVEKQCNDNPVSKQH